MSNEISEKSDTTYLVEIEFFADKLLGDSTVIKDIPRVPIAHYGGKIPYRKYANGYPTIPPLLEFGPKRQWTISMPYCYELPWSYFGGYFPNGEGGPSWLDGLTVCFALVIDSYRLYPSYGFWNSQPNTQTAAKSTELTRFMKQLSDDMGCTYSSTSDTWLAWSHCSTTIPNMMNKYKLERVNYVRYYPTQEGFDMLMNHLNTYNPIILMDIYTGPNGNKMAENCDILDGVCEIYTKVTTKKVVIGISVSTTVDYYYMDYFHRVSLIDHANDGWVLYDALNKTEDYVYLLKKKIF